MSICQTTSDIRQYFNSTDTDISAMNKKRVVERGSQKEHIGDFLSGLVRKYSGITINQVVDKIFRYENDAIKARFEKTSRICGSVCQDQDKSDVGTVGQDNG